MTVTNARLAHDTSEDMRPDAVPPDEQVTLVTIPGLLTPSEEVDLGTPESTLTKRFPDGRRRSTIAMGVPDAKAWLEPRILSAYGARGLYLATAFWSTQPNATLDELTTRVWGYSPSPVGESVVRTDDDILQGLAWCSAQLEVRVQALMELGARYDITQAERSRAKHHAFLDLIALRGMQLGLRWLGGGLPTLERAMVLILRSPPTRTLHIVELRTMDEVRYSLKWFTYLNHATFGHRGMWLSLIYATTPGAQFEDVVGKMWDLVPLPLTTPKIAHTPDELLATATRCQDRVEERVARIATHPSEKDAQWWLTTLALRGFGLGCRVLAGDIPTLAEAADRLF